MVEEADWDGARVTVHRLADGRGEFATFRDWRFRTVHEHLARPSEVRSLAGLWRSIPDAADQFRCHTPHHGLEVRRGDALVLRVAICFACWNISGRTEHGELWRPFDASSASAIELRRLMDSLLPAEAGAAEQDR